MYEEKKVESRKKRKTKRKKKKKQKAIRKKRKLDNASVQFSLSIHETVGFNKTPLFVSITAITPIVYIICMLKKST